MFGVKGSMGELEKLPPPLCAVLPPSYRLRACGLVKRLFSSQEVYNKSIQVLPMITTIIYVLMLTV